MFLKLLRILIIKIIRLRYWYENLTIYVVKASIRFFILHYFLHYLFKITEITCYLKYIYISDVNVTMKLFYVRGELLCLVVKVLITERSKKQFKQKWVGKVIILCEYNSVRYRPWIDVNIVCDVAVLEGF